MNIGWYHCKLYRIVFFAVLVCIVLIISGSQALSQPLAAGHKKFLGNTINFAGPGANWDLYWNQVTSENGGKWGTVEATRDQYNWTSADEGYNYAKARGIPYRFHVLVWSQQYPAWIGTLDSAEIYGKVEEYISLCAERYPDADYVEVLNEPLHFVDPGWPYAASLQRALGGTGSTGWDFVIKAFELARKYFPPKTKLYLNEYSVIGDDNSTTRYLEIINLLQERGLIGGIAFQGHRFELSWASVTTMRNNLDRLAATGLPIQVTEFDCGTDNNSQPSEAVTLSEYQRIFPMLWEHPAVEGITLWGYIQGTMWQRNCYLIRSDGSETPAFQWLKNYLSNGNVRTRQSGDWNDVNTWEKHDGTSWVPATSVPSLSDKAILISGGDTVTVTAPDSSNQLTVARGGTLVVDSGITLHIKNGEKNGLTVYGVLENHGTVAKEDSSVVLFVADGRYVHAQNGGTIPTAAWGAGSTCEVTGYVSGSKPDNLNQAFDNFVWNCTGQTSNVDWGRFNDTINGSVTVKSTGSAHAYLTSPASGTPNTITIRGNVNVEGGEFSSNGSGNAAEITVNTLGNVNVTGGNLSVSRGSGPTVAWNLLGNFSMSNAATQNSNPEGARFIFSGGTTHTLTLGEGNSITALPIEVLDAAALNVGTSVIRGSGIFALQSGATLGIAHPGGLDSAIQVTGEKIFSKEAGYIFNGTQAQATGITLPDTVTNLTVNNTAGLTLSDSVTVNGILDIQKGALLLGGQRLAYGANGSLKYSGTGGKTTSDIEFPPTGGPVNLIVANTGGVTLHESRTIPGNVELAGKLTLGSNTLTAQTATSTGATRFVITGTGALRLTSVSTTEKLFPVGTTYYAPVWIKNAGTEDTVGVSVEADAVPAAFGGRVNAKWKINEGTAGGGNYMLKFGWMTLLENNTFRADRARNAHIFWMDDTMEAGSGNPAIHFSDPQPYTISRGGITNLGTFAVGRFKDVPDGVGDDGQSLPAEFRLNQNYPNPFNPSTTISYSLAKPGQVRLSVYDLLGREIKVLQNEFRNTGEYSVVWGATDNNNTPVSSGMYFCRLETGGRSLQKKMLLVR